MFDMAIAFNSAMRDLGCIDRLTESARLTREANDKIWL